MAATEERIFVVAIMKPLPGKMAELEKLCLEGVKYQQETAPDLLGFHATKSLDYANYKEGWTNDAVEGELINVQVWANTKALEESGKTEWTQEMQTKVGPLLAGPPSVKVMKSYAGFRR
ncbi:MAG: hypothetical protein Q9160_008922 [Pyrenula sp. 1 TL-2023]